MSVITKSEFEWTERAVQASTAPTEIVAAFNELAAWREQLKRLGEAERYQLKAMKCPHHHRIFAAEPRRYRDLPLRLAEYGCCDRYEQSGELFGLMRVRSLNMNASWPQSESGGHDGIARKEPIDRGDPGDRRLIGEASGLLQP